MNLVVLLLFSIAFSTASCAVTVQPQLPSHLGVRQVFDKNYQLGRSQFANVGEPIVKVKVYSVERISSQYMRATDDFVVSGGIVTVNGKKGVTYPVKGQVGLDGKLLSVVDLQSVRGNMIGVLVMDDGSIYHKALNGNIPMIYTFSVSPPNVKFMRLDNERISATATYVNYELIYAGTDGKSLFVTYREYTKDDMARPAFYQNLVYARDADFVRFKEVKIKVHEISSERIVYSVIDDGLPSQ